MSRIIEAFPKSNLKCKVFIVQIIPAILTADKKTVENKLVKFRSVFDWLQIDVTDGVFVDNPTLSLEQFRNFPDLRYFKLDIHLMVNNPISFLPGCQKLKAKRATGQIEMMPNQTEFVQKIIDLKMNPGLAVDLPTPIEKIDQKLFPKLDIILLLTAKAGFGGQKFQLSVLNKIKKLSKIKKEKSFNFKIGLDCGINPSTIEMGYEAGADVFYAASYIAKEPKQALKELQKAVL